MVMGDTLYFNGVSSHFVSGDQYNLLALLGAAKYSPMATRTRHGPFVATPMLFAKTITR
jgi:hypothetical protein